MRGGWHGGVHLLPKVIKTAWCVCVCGGGGGGGGGERGREREKERERERKVRKKGREGERMKKRREDYRVGSNKREKGVINSPMEDSLHHTIPEKRGEKERERGGEEKGVLKKCGMD